MKIAIGCDEAGFDLKQDVIKHLEQKGIEVKDYGCYSKDPVLYPDVAVDVSLAVKNDGFDRGILICGTGIGMAITANKVPGIRAACCHDIFSAQRARRSNDAQIMTLGARVIASHLALALVDVWLDCEFDGGGSTPKVERIAYYEQKFLKGE